MKMLDEHGDGIVNAQPCGRWSALHQASEAGLVQAHIAIINSIRIDMPRRQCKTIDNA